MSTLQHTSKNLKCLVVLYSTGELILRPKLFFDPRKMEIDIKVPLVKTLAMRSYN